MKYKHYRKEGEEYILNTSQTTGRRQRVVTLLWRICSLIVWLAALMTDCNMSSKNINACPDMLLIGILIIGMVIISRMNTVRIYIEPSRRVLLVKSAYSCEEYGMEHFLSFQTICKRMYGFTVAWTVTMLFDDTGKHVAVPLAKGKEERIFEITQETILLLGIIV